MRSQIWKFFDQNKELPDKGICKTCENKIGCRGGTTSALVNHLKIHHEVYKEYENSRKNKASTSSSSEPPNKQRKIDHFLPKFFTTIYNYLN